VLLSGNPVFQRGNSLEDIVEQNDVNSKVLNAIVECWSELCETGKTAITNVRQKR
jgi:hypothetical protein